MNNYRDYVIKDGQFIGKFEEMYRECEDPWDADKEDYEASLCSIATKRIIKADRLNLVVSLGSGTGRHMQWLQCIVDGVEPSETACEIFKTKYPFGRTYNRTALNFLANTPNRYTIYLFREVLWYILPDWSLICNILSAYQGAMIIVELSFYDNQQYGRDYFDGPDDFIAKWPFGITKIVREHTTAKQREGRIMIAGRI